VNPRPASAGVAVVGQGAKPTAGPQIWHALLLRFTLRFRRKCRISGGHAEDPATVVVVLLGR
jgi:hypothetical protein